MRFFLLSSYIIMSFPLNKSKNAFGVFSKLGSFWKKLSICSRIFVLYY